MTDPAAIYNARVVNGLLTSTLPARGYARELIRVSIQGPQGSTVSVYVGPPSASQVVTNTTRGDLNTYEAPSSSPIVIPAGMELNVVWSTGSGTARATFYTRSP